MLRWHQQESLPGTKQSEGTAEAQWQWGGKALAVLKSHPTTEPHNKGKRQLVQNKIRTEVEEESYSKMISIFQARGMDKVRARETTQTFLGRVLGRWTTVTWEGNSSSSITTQPILSMQKGF